MPDFSKTRLATPRLELRPLTPDDAPVLFAIHSDPLVMRYWSTPPWPSIDTANEFIARDIAVMAAGDYVRLGIVCIDNATLVGSCTLYQLHEQCRRGEFGFALARSAWGQGYAHEASGALLRFGFKTLNLNRVEADVDPRNEASVKCLTRLGFVQEGLFRQRWIVGGHICDSAMYGLLRCDWAANNAADA